MDFLIYAVLGLGSGAIYGLLAQGIVAIYRSSGVLNLAHGAIAMASAYLFVDLHVDRGIPAPLAITIVVVVAALFGVLVQGAVMSPMRTGSTMTRVCATLGLLITLQAAVSLVYGSDDRLVSSYLPADSIQLWDGAAIGADRLIVLGIGVVVTVSLWCVYKFTQFGRLTTGVWQNADAVAALGGSPRLVATGNWALGAGLAGLCGCLIVPISGLQIGNLSMLIVPALAASIAGRFSSFPSAFIAGLILGSLSSVVSSYTSIPGLANAVPFVAIIVLLVVRGRSLPVRGDLNERLPSVGNARFGRTGITMVAVVLLGAAMLGPTAWVGPITTTSLVILIAMSIIVITGYTGQFNLAPYAFAGVSALLGAYIANSWGWSLIPSMLAGAALAVPVGLLVAIPAIRARGANLAVITLALGAVAESLIFNNNNLNGGIAGISTGEPSIFGWPISTVIDPTRYATVVLVVVVLVGFLLVHIRRGPSGRRLLAVRDNERAAASVGIGVSATKIFAFSLAAFIAGLYGVLATQRTGIATFGEFSAFGSLVLVGTVILAGVGSIGGAAMAGIIASGGIIYTWAGFLGIDEVLPLISGLMLTLTLVLQPSGIIPSITESVGALGRRLRPRQRQPAALPPADTTAPVRVSPRTLRVEGLCVEFGTVKAVNELSLTVEPGEILGLIGPNGAGKTAALDAVTGFIPSRGTVSLGGVDLSKQPPHRRAIAGVGRSFQGIELFDDLTIGENVIVGNESGGIGAHLRDLVTPAHSRMSPSARAAIELFKLEPYLDDKPSEVPFSIRRLAGIARAVASSPSVVLLDEPAAGLDANEVSELTSLLRLLAEQWGMAIILVEHHIDMVVAACDRVQVMVLGRTLVTGTGQEIENDERVKAAYLGGQPVMEDGA
ncbi:MULTISPECIES: ATP-binding cassette domain-containing protein [unclassified Microbacterium]|uniref:ABC transporter permease subunit n=1 Tax=unclassified Microbacterium TaxID=2609290 RepID=UPI00214BD44C|nr:MULTISPECIES: ATP-binding cassette domain-containing protein [unclassified Microbacterium]MCR2783093.1 ATP-binding cassette domain-containing protein [Microbacterium sp. zg.B96]WIM16023.1 ATP-binding cassette domain-containing protein [Microbacterium sp. zg-B96]